MARAELISVVGPAPGYYRSYTEQNSGFVRPRLLENNIDPLVVGEIVFSEVEDSAYRAATIQGRWEFDPDQSHELLTLRPETLKPISEKSEK